MNIYEATNYFLPETIEYRWVLDGEVGDIEFDDDEELLTKSDNYLDQLSSLERKSGINILRGKDVTTIATDVDRVVGALYEEYDEPFYSFDVIVDPEYAHQGIGNKLVDIGISDFNQYESMNPESKIRLEVVNSAMEQILNKKGFEAIRRDGTNSIMMLRGETDDEDENE